MGLPPRGVATLPAMESTYIGIRENIERTGGHDAFERAGEESNDLRERREPAPSRVATRSDPGLSAAPRCCGRHGHQSNGWFRGAPAHAHAESGASDGAP